MRITRRDFLKYCSVAAGALGLSASGLVKLEKAMALSTGPEVIWIAGSACTGCSVSLLNTMFYMDIVDLAVNTIDLKYHDTIMAAAGDLATSVEDFSTAGVLVVEGGVPTAAGGNYCVIAGETMKDKVIRLGNAAGLVLSVGTCSSFGGIPGARPNPTGIQKVTDVLKNAGVTTTVINIPGCPPHPDWIVGTIAYYLATGQAPALNSYKSPRDYYGQYQCNAGPCPWQKNDGTDKYTGATVNNTDKITVSSKYARGKVGCLGALGCKGRKTKADCSYRLWNTSASLTLGTNWCVGTRGGCHGCTSPDFPDNVGKFFNFG